MKYFIQLAIVLCIFSCKKVKNYNGPDSYADDFEYYNQTSDLIEPVDKNWSFTQLTMLENKILIDTNFSHTGKKSLKFTAIQSDNTEVSKCSLVKHNMRLSEYNTVRISAWYFISGNEKLNWIFLMDLEEQIAIGAAPGIRIALESNKLLVERKKIKEKDVKQKPGEEIDFPRNQWVEIVLEINLSQKKNGSIKLWQNGQLILEAKNTRTLPKDFLYFQQGTKAMFTSLEIGITANSNDGNASLWVDDVKLETF